MKIYLTKYALTRGIIVLEDNNEYEFSIGEKTLTRYRKIDAPKQNNRIFINTIFKPDWHLTKEEAIERAEEMRIKEIETCFRKIKRLAKFNFKINID